MTISDKKLELIESVKAFFQQEGRFPTTPEIANKLKIPRRSLRRYFKNHTTLVEEVKKTIDEPLFTKQRADKTKQATKKAKVFFVTTAVVGAPVFKEALDSVKRFCNRNKAELLVIPAADPAASVSEGLDPILAKENLVFENTSLNENLSIFTLKLSAKQIQPTTGLARIGQRNKSFIFASPKQSLEYTPISNNKLPHALMTTGAITLPEYGTNKYMSMRTAFIAEHDHVLGGIIVELEAGGMYHFRQVQFNKDGSFSDMGTKYYPNKKEEVDNVKAIILGDWHFGATCHVVEKTTYQMIADLNPEMVVLHDLNNGAATNHHIKNTAVTKAKIASITIEEELGNISKFLKKLETDYSLKSIEVVKSNHDEWLNRYLENGEYPWDKNNFEIAHELAIAMFKGKDPMEVGIRKFNKLTKTNFRQRDEDLILFGIQLGAHGDRPGRHGGMPLMEVEKAYSKAVIGHAHTAAIMRGVFRVGTSTELREAYAKGPISWTNTHCVINKDGSRQLINIINGKYTI